MIALILFLVLGCFIAKEFRRGLVALVASLLVFTPLIAIGVLYNVVYPFYMAVKQRSIKAFFFIWWRLINGTFATLGNAMYDGVAIKWDEMGNVWGEWLEDIMTIHEKTPFGDKNTTISESIGYLEIKEIKTFGIAEKISKLLNKVFREERHCIGSWKVKKAIEEIKDKNYYGTYKNIIEDGR